MRNFCEKPLRPQLLPYKESCMCREFLPGSKRQQTVLGIQCLVTHMHLLCVSLYIKLTYPLLVTETTAHSCPSSSAGHRFLANH